MEDFYRERKRGVKVGRRGAKQIHPRDQREIKKLVKKEVSLEHQHKAIEGKLALIQQSTQTSVGIFSKLHNDLRMKYRWYYNWHLHPLSNEYHLYMLILVVFVGVIMNLIYTCARNSTMNALGGYV